MLSWCASLSRVTHDAWHRVHATGQPSESWCSRAWRLQDQHLFWRWWVRVFGRDHCARSHRHYWGSTSSPPTGGSP